MSQNPNYFKIGLFVIAGILFLAVAIIIFGAGKFFEKKYIVETYFDQSIQGLDVGAALKFQGVQVGNISEIGFVFQDYNTDYQYVLVRAEIYPNKVGKKGIGELFIDEKDREQGFKEMIKHGLRLQLASQGITGIAFLNAVYLDPERHGQGIWARHEQDQGCRDHKHRRGRQGSAGRHGTRGDDAVQPQGVDDL